VGQQLDLIGTKFAGHTRRRQRTLHYDPELPNGIQIFPAACPYTKTASWLGASASVAMVWTRMTLSRGRRQWFLSGAGDSSDKVFV